MEVIIESRCSTKVFSAHIEVPLEIASRGFRPPFFKHADDLPFTHDLYNWFCTTGLSLNMITTLHVPLMILILTSDSLMLTPCTLSRNFKRWSTVNNCIEACFANRLCFAKGCQRFRKLIIKYPRNSSPTTTSNIRSEIYESMVCVDANSFHSSLGEHLQVLNTFVGGESNLEFRIVTDFLVKSPSRITLSSLIACQESLHSFKLCPDNSKYHAWNTHLHLLREASSKIRCLVLCGFVQGIYVCIVHHSIIAAPWSVQQVQATDLLVHGASRLYVHVPNES